MGSQTEDPRDPKQPSQAVRSSGPLSLAPDGLTEDIDDSWGDDADGALPKSPAVVENSVVGASLASSKTLGSVPPGSAGIGIGSDHPAVLGGGAQKSKVQGAGSSRPFGTSPSPVAMTSSQTKQALASAGLPSFAAALGRKRESQPTAIGVAGKAVIANSGSKSPATGVAGKAAIANSGSKSPDAKRPSSPATSLAVSAAIRGRTSESSSPRSGAAPQTSERSGASGSPQGKPTALDAEPVGLAKTISLGVPTDSAVIIERGAISGPEYSADAPECADPGIVQGDSVSTTNSSDGGSPRFDVSKREEASESASETAGRSEGASSGEATLDGSSAVDPALAPSTSDESDSGKLQGRNADAADAADTEEERIAASATVSEDSSATADFASSEARDPLSSAVSEPASSLSASEQQDAESVATASVPPSTSERKVGSSVWLWVLLAVAAALVVWFVTRSKTQSRDTSTDGLELVVTRPQKGPGAEAKPDPNPEPIVEPVGEQAQAPAASANAEDAELRKDEADAASPEVAQGSSEREDRSDDMAAAPQEPADEASGLDEPSANTQRVELVVEPLDTKVGYRGAEVKRPYVFNIPRGKRMAVELARKGYVTRRVVLDGSQAMVRIGMRLNTPVPKKPTEPKPEAVPPPEPAPDVDD